MVESNFHRTQILPSEKAFAYKMRLDAIDTTQATPSHVQAIRMRRFAEEGRLTTEAIQTIMEEEKPNQRGKSFCTGTGSDSIFPLTFRLSSWKTMCVRHWSFTVCVCESGTTGTADKPG